jgi:hypothetical protein
MAQFNPEMLNKTRYKGSFEVLRGYDNHGHLTSTSGSTWLAGTVLDVDAGGYVTIAASGAGQWFALQNVADLSSMNGRRNLNNTEANKGDVIGCQYGVGMAATAVHAGYGSPGDVGVWNGSTLVFVAKANYVAGTHGKALCRLESADGEDTTQTLTAAGATAGSYSTASNIKAIIRFNIPLV